MATEAVVNRDKRRFLIGATSVVGGLGAVAVAVPFVMSLWPSERAKAAGAPVEVDISKIEPGQKINVEWRGKVCWLVNRTQAMLSTLPKLDGVEVCRRLRDSSDVSILILTARTQTDDRVVGLDSGADDYLVKPFERAELLARLRALLRRRPPRGSAFLVAADLRLNPDTHEVYRGERALELTAREFELLEHLMRNERIVVSRQALLDEVWGYHPFAETNTVDVFISNLRRKLEAGGEPRLLHTVRGAGYVLRANP